MLFEHQRDPVAVTMAAFTSADPDDRAAFDAHWTRIMSADSVEIRAIVLEDTLVGSVLAYRGDLGPEVSYWIGRDQWGRGIATAALAAFVAAYPDRPLYARAAKDNLGSLRVLEKNGFATIDEATGFAAGRGEDTEEWVLMLAGPP